MPRAPRLRHLLPIFALLLMLPLLAGCGGDGDSEATTSLLPMTLAEWLVPPDAPAATADPLGVAHLDIEPMKPGDNDLTIRLTDLDGAPLDTSGSVTLAWRLLAPDAKPNDAGIAPVDGEPSEWTASGVKLADPAWYAFDVTLDRDGATVATSTLYALLPDPSVYGSDAVDTPESDTDAEALYQRAVETYGAWETGRWRENLGSGQDVLVVTQYAVDSRDSGQAAMTMSSLYAGAFRPGKDGAGPTVQRDFSRRVAIGKRWWSEENGAWSEASGLPVAGFPERADIYGGATSFRPAGTETIGGVETRVITFYLPAKGGQAEAWFAWWIDPDTGNVVRMAMVAEMHFMIWDFYDVNAPLDIASPTGDNATPAASPVATPAN